MPSMNAASPGSLRQALVEHTHLDVQELQQLIGHLAFGTSADHPGAGVHHKSTYDSKSRTITMLVDRVIPGREAVSLANEIVRWHGPSAAKAVMGDALDKIGFDPEYAEQVLRLQDTTGVLNADYRRTQDQVNPLIVVSLIAEDGSREEVEFRASEVLEYNGEDRAWAELANDPVHQYLQTSLAEDYALWKFRRQYGDDGEYEVNVERGLTELEVSDTDAGMQLVQASQFHSMRGHVAEGVRVQFSTGEVLAVRSAMKGWNLESDDGKVHLGPYDGAMALTEAIVQREAFPPQPERVSEPSPGM